MKARHLLHFSLGLLATACAAPQAVRDAAPPIQSTVGKKKAPDQDVLPIISSEAIAVDAEKAAENYREILKLAPDDNTKREASRRLADLQVQMEDAKGNDGDNATKALRESIKLYNELLQAKPDDPQNDRVFYQLSRAYQNVGDTEAAVETLQKLTTRHPNSEYTGDAHFRRAELLFTLRRYDQAEGEYKTVMDLADKTPFFIPAQYKFGWSRYKQSNYEGALEVFIAILDRELPQGDLYDTKTALEGVAGNRADMTRDGLRVVSLSLIALGGGPAINDYLGKRGDPRFFPLIYTATGEALLDKRRYTDAAATYAAFTTRYPKHGRAPDFQSRVIAAYAEGGFNDLVVREKERYATVYDPAADYWGGQPVRADVLTELRKHFEDLAKHYYAIGQASGRLAAATGEKPEEADYKDPAPFLVAARWYQRTLEVFPTDRNAPGLSFMVGESLYNGGKIVEAAEQYTRTAYDYPAHAKAAEAGYAAVLAYQKNARKVAPAARPDALKLAIAASVKFADKFPAHPEVYPVLTRTAEDLFELKDYEQSVVVAKRVLTAPRAVDYQLRRTAWSVTGDSQFALKKYPEAEQAFSEELKLTPKNSPAYADTTEQLAAAIYKQGEVARDAGDLRTAANQFLRVGSVTPTAKIRSTAEYDGATMLLKLEDWPAAQKVLENFRTLFPGNALEADVDKKLAVAYQKDNKPVQAAGAFARIARRATETTEVRLEAAWLAATLFDEGKATNEAYGAYEFYAQTFARPFDRALDARQRLADIAKDRGDKPNRLRWLREVMLTHDNGGSERTERSKALAATAALDVAKIVSADAKTLRISAPLEKSLPQKKQAMETAIAALSKAAGYGYAEITTSATFELGSLYQDFGKALMDSERPKKLSELELEQYNVLLEEQAYPFEEKAIQTHESNLKRITQGLYDEWIAKSAKALAQMAPAKYGKREKGEDFYATLK